MSIFSESTEESIIKERNAAVYNALKARGLSAEDIAKLIGDKATYEGVKQDIDYHWRFKLPWD